MGRKKKFIDKKKAATFQLLARDSTDPNFDDTPGNDRVFVRVDNSAYSVDTFFGDGNEESDSIFDDAPQENDGGRASHSSSLPEHVRREILELGFPDDGYNYLYHLREIKNAGGGSAFYQNPKFKVEELPRDVKAYDATRVKVKEVETDANEKSIYSVASKSVGVKVQRVVDPEVAALLDDSDLSRFGSDVEDLEEDFVVQANNADGKFDSVEESDDEENVVGESDQIVEALDDKVTDEPRARRPLDDQFDMLESQEYGSDSDNDYEGYMAEEESTLAEKLNNVLKDNVADDLDLDDEYRVPADILHAKEIPKSKEHVESAAGVIRRCIEYAEKYENEDEDAKVVFVEESSDESEQWDCETIVSTYSNLDNHPGKIGAPEIARRKKLSQTISEALSVNNHVISLKGKEKLPVDFLPRGSQSSEKVKDVDELKSEQIKRKQIGQESKEEKKERKAAVKAERREARQAKKEMKGLYRSEAQHAQRVAAVSGPSSRRLM